MQDNLIILNIGGIRYHTTKTTLSSQPESILNTIEDQPAYASKISSNEYFIDRDGKYFKHILNYFRTGEIEIPADNQHLIQQLYLESKFYNIQILSEHLTYLIEQSQLARFQLQDLLEIIQIRKPLQLPRSTFSFTQLRFLDFSYSNLIECDFQYSSLFEVNFTKARMSKSLFQGAEIKSCIFTQTVLVHCDLSDSKISSSQFTQAHCNYTSFKNAEVASCDFRSVSLQYSDLSDSSFKVTNLSKCNIGFSNTTRINLKGSNIKNIIGLNE